MFPHRLGTRCYKVKSLSWAEKSDMPWQCPVQVLIFFRTDAVSNILVKVLDTRLESEVLVMAC